ncbi:Cytochrome P450 [Dillenia turbinata]|uniref:Cytochrome P450 n=1 Tax=Dillenia turbinata TaxID=194707 RepID=A0AAN8VW32_9MAGN
MRPKIEKMHRKVDKMLESIVDVHKVSSEKAKKTEVEAEEEDLVDVLLKLQQGEDLEFSVTNENVKAVILATRLPLGADLGPCSATLDTCSYQHNTSHWYFLVRTLMELQFPSFSLIIAFLLFSFTFVRVGKRLNLISPGPKLPPGPWKLPLIGNMHQLVGSQPHHVFASLTKIYGPIMHLKVGERSTVVVSSPEIAEQIMRTHDLNFAYRPYLLASKILSYESTTIASAPYGNYWRELRKICMIEVLSAKRVESFRSLREEEVSSLIETTKMEAGSPVNLTEKLFAVTNRISARTAFGKKCKSLEEIISAIKEGLRLRGGFSIADLYPSVKVLEVISGMKLKLAKVRHEIDRVLDNIINEHKERKKTTSYNRDDKEEDDLVDVLLRIQENDELAFPLTTNNIKAILLVLSYESASASGNYQRQRRSQKNQPCCRPPSAVLSHLVVKSDTLLSRPILLLVSPSLSSYYLGIKKRFKPINSTPKLPPGPWKLPLIGNMHQLVGAQIHHLLADLAKIYGPLMRLKLGELSVVVVSSAEIAEEIMKTHDINFAQRPYLLASRIMSYDSTGIGFSPYGTYWRHVRKICVLELLSAKRVRSFQFLREEEVSSFIESIRPKVGSPINLSEKILSLTYGISARSAFGKCCEDQEAVISAVKEAMRLGAGFGIVDLYPSLKMLQYITGIRSKLEKLQRKTDRVLENIINEHRERKRNVSSYEVDKEEDDLVDVLLKIQEDVELEVPLTTDNIKAVILFPSSLYSSPFLLFTFMILKKGKKFKQVGSSPKLPPGPWKQPLIGNMHQLVGSRPHHFLTDLSKIYGPLMHLKLGEVSMLIVSSPEIAEEILSEKIFSLTYGITARAAFG